MQSKTGEIKLQYGLKDGILIHIDKIVQEERGLKCKCVCPYCNIPLQARLGTQRKHHFAHNNLNCSPEIAQQTILHLLAKEIIEEERTIVFPPYDILSQKMGIHSDMFLSPYRCVEKMSVKFDSVVLEKRISDIVPDIIVQKDGRECLIEIAVTHFIDEEKQKKIDKLGLPMIEIDLSKYDSKYNIDKQALKKLLIEDIECKKWISNPRVFEHHKEKAIATFKKKLEEHEQWKHEKEKIEELNRKKREEQERKRIEVSENIRAAFLEENYKDIIKNLRNDEKVILDYKRTKMYQESSRMPFYLDIPIEGEFIFNCDRRVWQMVLFEMFIYERDTPKEGTAAYSTNFSIESFFVKRLKCLDLINWKYYNKILLRDVIARYLSVMECLGFLHCTRDEIFIEYPHTLVPPNEKNATILKKAILMVDSFSMDADRKTEDIFSRILNQEN